MECFSVDSYQLEGRIDPYYYKPVFRSQIDELLKTGNCVPVGSVVRTWNRGDGPRAGFYTEDKSNGVYFLRVQNLKEHSIDLTDVKYINRVIHENTLKRTKVRSGDVIFAISGTKDNLGTVSILPMHIKEANLNSALIRLDLNESIISKRYFCYFFDLEIARKQIDFIGKGAAQNNLNNKEISQIKIPLPSLLIQNQIVNIMQSAYSQKKQKEAESQRLLDSIDGYVLDELDIKPSEVKNRMCFVANSYELNNNRVDVEYYQPKFEEIEKGMRKGNFEVKKLIDVFEKDLVKGILPNDAEKEGNIKVLQIKNILRNGLIDISEYITAKNIFTSEHKINKGEVIIVITGATIGKVGLWDFDEEFCLGGDMIKFTTNSKFNPYYVLAFLLSQLGQYQLLREITGATNKHLSPNDIKKIQIPLPPLPIQNKIAVEVKRRISEAERLKTEAGKVIAEAKKKIEEMILGAN